MFMNSFDQNLFSVIWEMPFDVQAVLTWVCLLSNLEKKLF